jgi:hypothetical protein
VKTLALCLPRYGVPEPEHAECLDALLVATESGPYRLGMAVGSGPNIDIVRAQIASQAAPAELWLWLDSDMVFDPAEVLRMIQEADQRQAIVGGLYVAKQPGGSLQASVPGEQVECFERGGVFPAKAFGFGCVAMPSRLYTRIAEELGVRPVDVRGERVLPLFQPIVDDAGYRSDDYSFCLRARRAGVSLFVDTRPRLGHVGRQTFYLDDAPPRERATSLTLKLGDRS